jgi:hypothetical protein
MIVGGPVAGISVGKAQFIFSKWTLSELTSNEMLAKGSAISLSLCGYIIYFFLKLFIVQPSVD